MKNIIDELNQVNKKASKTGQRVIAIFGDPIGHSLSPVIQNAAFSHLDLPFIYHAFHVRPGRELKDAVAAIKALDMAGANTTIPHKESVIEHLDIISADARAIGAVNTIVNKDNQLTGYNTDGLGYVRSLVEETAFDSNGKNILIIGAGGAARGIIFALLKNTPNRITIMNRTLEKAEKLAGELSSAHKDTPITIAELNDRESIKEAALIINTTSIGMVWTAMADETPISLEYTCNDTIISDIVYMPLLTPFIKQAIKKGLKTHTGLGMLVCQGALGFELWTDTPAPIDIMMKAARKALETK
jgi:shikimate dehydrogenase